MQRIVELFTAKRNEKIMLSRGAEEYDSSGYKFIRAMHIGFFMSLIAESIFIGRNLNPCWIYFFIIFAAAQFLRYWAIISLGYYWNTKIIVLKTGKIIKKGSYKYFKHPNYAAVTAELAVIPLIFSCYITLIVFSVLNFIVLRRRKRIEEEALKTTSGFSPVE